MKICKDCKHYRPETRTDLAECHHPLNMGENLVDGAFIALKSPWVLRYEENDPCGKEGKLWTPRPIVKHPMEE